MVTRPASGTRTTRPAARGSRPSARRERGSAGRLTEVDDGTFVPEARGKVLFSDWAAQFATMSVDLAPGTINRRVSDLKNWVLPEFGHRALSSITQPDVRAWVAAMTKAGCNAGSVKLRYETLSTIFGATVDAATHPSLSVPPSRTPALRAARCDCSRSVRW